jgi:hypothetical protein
MIVLTILEIEIIARILFFSVKATTRIGMIRFEELYTNDEGSSGAAILIPGLMEKRTTIAGK